MLGDKCKHDLEFTCFHFGHCQYDSITQCLKMSVNLLARQVEHLTHTKMRKHSEASTKWRSQALYFRSKCKSMEAWVAKQGLVMPSSVELNKMDRGTVKDGRGRKKGYSPKRALEEKALLAEQEKKKEEAL